MMSDQIKFIVQELNKPPFNQKFNLISFDALRSDQLLQILSDVFSEIDPKMKSDVRSEDAEQVAIKMMGILRILKYKPPPDSDMTSFRQGLVSSNKVIVQHILEWTLQRLPELKKRAYLARFLVKVELAPDIEGDADIQDLYQEYEHLMEEFKEVHRQSEQMRGSGNSTQEIRRDLKHMEEEREQLSKKIDRLKRKVEGQPQRDSMLSVAKKLREEKEKAAQHTSQKTQQKALLSHAEQKIQRLTQQLKELKHSSLGATPEGLLQKLEEEVRVNSYLAKEKVPKEIRRKQRHLEDIKRVAHEPAMGRTDLDQLHAKIQIVNSEMNQLIEKRMINNDPTDDKLSLFRQQAAIVTRKKESSAEQLKDSRSELSQLQEELQEKKEQLKGYDGDEVLRGDEFKRYVNKLRSKSTIYKKKRQELAELRAEIGVLARSEEILKSREKHISQSLNVAEEERGVEGFHSTQEELEKVSTLKAQLDERKGQTLEDMASMVRRLNAKIAEKKARLAPIIKELRPLRQQCQDMTMEYEQKKSSYDSCVAGLESNLSKLEQDVTSLRDDVLRDESRNHYLNCMMDILEVQHKKLADEIKSYVSNDPQDKKKSMREQLTRHIQEQESQSRSLREQQRHLQETYSAKQRQMQMWQDLQVLIECKRRSRMALIGGSNAGTPRFTTPPRATTSNINENRLVLLTF